MAKKDTTPPKRKLLVADTNALMENANLIYSCDEHDICVPEPVVEELDDHKKGFDEINRNSRQSGRNFDELQIAANKVGINLRDGIPLNITGHKEARGKLFLGPCGVEPPVVFPVRSNDNQIIERALYHKKNNPEYLDVIVLSNDANVRIKARNHGLTAESVRGDVEVSDDDVIPNNYHETPDSFWQSYERVEVNQKNGINFYTLFGPTTRWMKGDIAWLPGQHKGKDKMFVQVVDKSRGVLVLRQIGERHPKQVWGIEPRNDLQAHALRLLLSPDIPFVSLIGVAGTGKTLLTLAAGLMLTLEFNLYTEIIMTRVTVPVGEEIGFLPGNEQEKMNPWMGALDDNLDVLTKPSDEAGDWGRSATRDIVRSRIKVKSLSFMRGRTFINKFVVVDEAQNLNQKQAKTIISRAGEGTKMVFLGNVAQIDTPYLSEHNCGLVQTLHRFRNGGFIGSGYVQLRRGERSVLADAANMYL